MVALLKLGDRCRGFPVTLECHIPAPRDVGVVGEWRLFEPKVFTGGRGQRQNLLLIVVADQYELAVKTGWQDTGLNSARQSGHEYLDATVFDGHFRYSNALGAVDQVSGIPTIVTRDLQSKR